MQQRPYLHDGRHLRRQRKLRASNVAGPQPLRPAITPLGLGYLVRVRNIAEPDRGAWATYAKAARTGVAMSQAELARRLDVDRVTIWRWETGKQRPEDQATVKAFADVLNLDLDEALAAAGLKLDVAPPRQPTRERDEELEIILTADLPQAIKQELIEHLLDQREQDKRRRMDNLRLILKRRRSA